MTQAWPTFDAAHNWAAEEEAFEKVMDYIKAVRTMRTEMNVHPAKKTSMIIETADAAPFQNAQVYLAKFAFATDVTFTEKYEGSTDGMVQVSTHAARAGACGGDGLQLLRRDLLRLIGPAAAPGCDSVEDFVLDGHSGNPLCKFPGDL